MIRWTSLCIALSLSVAPAQQQPNRQALEVGTAAVAKIAATAVFLQNRDAKSVLEFEFAPVDLPGRMLQATTLEVDRRQRSVTATLLGVSRTAIYRPGLGSALVLGDVLPSGSVDAPVEPAEPSTVAWPTGDLQAYDLNPEGVDRRALALAVKAAFKGYAPPADPQTRAVLVVHRGKIVAEKYGLGFTADSPLHGWSMSKGITDALVGVRFGSDPARLTGPTNLTQWNDASDQRAMLSIERLLRMESGLEWDESYTDLGSDVIRMLFTETDIGAFAAAKRVEFVPGTFFEYSSGTTNILCRLLRESFGSDAEYHSFPRRALFNKIGMHRAVFETDPSGTFIGSSFVYATARDWARFGMLYLNDGVWEGERVLPAGWVKASTTPTESAVAGSYGRHWWLNAGESDDPAQRPYPNLPRDMFYASGYDGQLLAVIPSRDAVILRLGATKQRGAFRNGPFLASILDALPKPVDRGFSIPQLDLSDDTNRQVVVGRDPKQYLGHPTTVLLEDGKTMLCVYPKGHGKGGIVYKRSEDAGRTWSDRLPVPASWATSKEVPTIHRTYDAEGVARLILFSGLHPIRMSVSEDDGATWSELAPIGDFGGIVTMASVEQLANGDYMAVFHDDGRFLKKGGTRAKPPVFHVYKTVSSDGGLTWGAPEVIATHPTAHLCEPGIVRSPDGRQLAMLLRENSRKMNSFICFSDDEGATWSEPREVPGALTGDRHTARYVPDGKLFISFRDTGLESPTKGDWVAWVGTYEDLVKGREGQFRVRLMDNHHRWDCAYPAVEVLADGTVVTTTYGHWTAGEPPYIVSVRLRVDELEAMLPR